MRHQFTLGDFVILPQQKIGFFRCLFRAFIKRSPSLGLRNWRITRGMRSQTITLPARFKNKIV
ncbi:MAG: hypothetical protein KME01_02845 [Chroococcus sp. CMT-3BRIN-NPC107]|nr:hypothetical protein [Chroococcus sp. CMT-3BRIN-NPC107]